MPRSLVYAIPFYEPAIQHGGSVTVLRDVCVGMAARGHRVRVVTTDLGIGPDLPRDCWVERSGCEVWYARGNPLSRVAPYWTPMARAPLTAALADADVLHLSPGLTLTNALGRSLARRLGVPYVYTPQGNLCPLRLRSRRLSKAVFLRLVERRIVRDAAAVQVLTAREADDVLRQGARREQLHVIPNGVNPIDPSCWPSGDLFRDRFGIPRGAPLVLYLGQLRELKGIDLLLEAFGRVRAAHPDAVLALVGPDAGWEAEARRRVEGLGASVRFTGLATGELRWSAFRSADVFVLLSQSEGLPLAVLEACALGVPVLITDRCNLPEVAEYGAGCVVSPEVGEAAEVLTRMLADEPARQRMADAGRRLIEERFSIRHVLDLLEQLYARLLRKGPE